MSVSGCQGVPSSLTFRIRVMVIDTFHGPVMVRVGVRVGVGVGVGVRVKVRCRCSFQVRCLATLLHRSLVISQ